jgi:hypothetical protein
MGRRRRPKQNLRSWQTESSGRLLKLPTLSQHRRARLILWSDGLAAAVAASMPWSTSATSILIAIWLAVTLPTLDLASIRREVQSLPGGLPVLLALLAAAGTLWTDASWDEWWSGLTSFVRFLLIPVLLAHFRRSDNVAWMLYAFLAACTALLVASFVLYTFPIHVRPRWELMTATQRAVPVKDYIVQSGLFVLCAAGLCYAAFTSWMAGRRKVAFAAAVVAGLFLFNIAFIVTGRTALVVIPVLLVLLGFRLFGWKGVLGGAVAAGVLCATLWFSSSYLRERVTAVFQEMKVDRTDAQMSSTGQRLEFWRKSTQFVLSAPVLGHGTGSIKGLFQEAAVGQTGAAGLVADNPHQQTFAVAIQLGLIGAAVLWAMWISHLLLFRGTSFIAWLGLVVVAQNIVSSLFNSHLFDFTQGWVYVFGVGALGGAPTGAPAASVARCATRRYGMGANESMMPETAKRLSEAVML